MYFAVARLFSKLPRPRDSEVTFVVFESKLPPVATSLTTEKTQAISLSALPKDTTSEFATYFSLSFFQC